jgi:competence protein ComEA
MCEFLHRGLGPGATPSPEATGWGERIGSVARGPFARPLGRAGLILGAVVFLSWLGARSAQSTTPPAGEPDPQVAGLVTLSAAHPDAAAQEETVELAGKPVGATDAGADAATPPPSGVLPDGRIVLNAATAEELCRLPAVGPSRAAKIVELRARLGGFRSVRQLLRVKGIGPRTLKRITPLVVLDAPKGQEPTDGG